MSRIPICKQVPCQRLLPLVFVPADPAGLQQIIPEVIADSRLVRSAALSPSPLEKNLADGIEDDLHIPQERDALDVLQIGGQLVLPDERISASGLRQTAQARTHAVALALFRGHEHHVPHQLGPGADDGHVSPENVERLRQLIQAGGPQHFTEFRKTLRVR